MNPEPGVSGKTRVLVIDDSAIVRRVLTDALSAHSDLEVVGTAPDPLIARDKIGRLKPDVLTLDIEMPRMDGLTFLKEIMRERPIPVVIISSLAQSSSRAALEALEFGAVDVVAKPGGPYSVGDLKSQLPHKIRAAAKARLRSRFPGVQPPVFAGSTAVWHSRAMIALGASTGGTEALRQILMSMPADCPPILVVQHIPAVFSRAFAERLNGCCRIRVKEAIGGDVPAPGAALIAPGNFHMTLERVGWYYSVSVQDGPPVCYQRPSVDVLFESVARNAGKWAVGAILTGMGSDGAQGLLKMKNAGAQTIAQDEETCVVFGMPKEAIRLCCVDEVLPLDQIAKALIRVSSNSDSHLGQKLGIHVAP